MFFSCIIGLVVCVAALGVTMFLEQKNQDIQQELLDIIETPEVIETQTEAVTQSEETTQQDLYLAQLAEIYALNNDFVGWVSVAGTAIDYPVMQTTEDEEYYLRRDFYGDYSIAGTIFASAASTFDPVGDNIILYGHNMSSGTMFADLLNYQSQEYWQTHQTVQFDTLNGAQTYEIVYAFVVDVAEGTEHFAFYDFTTAADQAEFTDFIQNCKAYALYDTDNDPIYGDALLTLVTCKGYQGTTRMVVVAKAVDAS